MLIPVLNCPKVSSNRVLLMDEVDGMAGNEDRGGIAELIALLKTSKVRVCFLTLFSSDFQKMGCQIC